MARRLITTLVATAMGCIEPTPSYDDGGTQGSGASGAGDGATASGDGSTTGAGDSGGAGSSGSGGATSDTQETGGGGSTTETEVPDDWMDPSWRARLKFTLDNSARTTTDLVGFPVLLSIDGATIDLSTADAAGADLRFTNLDGEPLPHELEAFVRQGMSHIWVRVLQIDKGSIDGGIYMYFDNPAAADAQSPSDVFSAGFAAVYHLDEDLVDSTGLGSAATDMGSSPGPGQVAGGRSFVYADADAVLIDDSSFPAGNAARTGCGWARSTWMDGNTKHWMFSYGVFEGGGGFFFGQVDDELWCGGVGDDVKAAGVFTFDTWTHVCCVYDAGEVTLYQDGVAVQGPEAKGWTLTLDQQAFIGGHINPGVERWQGHLDEMRLSSTARSADWIAASHDNMTGGLVVFAGAERL